MTKKDNQKGEGDESILQWGPYFTGSKSEENEAGYPCLKVAS